MNYKDQADHFGTDNRLIQLAEECGELISVSTRCWRFLTGDATLRENYTEEELRNNLAEEIADVTLVASEVRHLYGISEAEIFEIIASKLKRTEGLM